MTLDDLEKKSAAANEINWITASFMIAFHVGAIAALFFFSWKGLFTAAVSQLGFRQPRHRHGLSPAADASRLQDSEMGRIFSDRLRHARARRRPDFLGGHAPHPPSVFRQGRRSAFADRRQVVGAHGLDPDGQVDAPRHDDAGALRPRPGERQVSRLDHEISLRSDDRARRDSARDRRISSRALGHFPSHRHRPAFDLAGEFGHAFVGHAALPDARPFDEQLVGGAACRSAKAGTTITTRIRRPRGTAWPGTRSTSTGTASGRSRSSASRRTSIRVKLPEERNASENASRRGNRLPLSPPNPSGIWSPPSALNSRFAEFAKRCSRPDISSRESARPPLYNPQKKPPCRSQVAERKSRSS